MVEGRVFHKYGAAFLNTRTPHRVVVFCSSSAQVGTYSMLVGGLQFVTLNYQIHNDSLEDS